MSATMMKAAVLSEWELINVQQVAVPEPQPGEALVQVVYAGICGSDVHIFKGTNPIATTPVIPGHEFMGRVVSFGTESSSHAVKVGQRVAVQPLVFCGVCRACRDGVPHVCEKLTVIGVNRDGGFAQYVTVPVDCLFEIPDDLNDQTAVLAEPFSVGMHAARRGGVRESDHVLIIGAGPIGVNAAVLIRKLGVQSVHLVEPNVQRRAYASALGFDVTDPTETDAVGLARKAAGDSGYDLAIETSGVFAGLDFATKAAAVRGRIVTLGFPAAKYNEYNITDGIVKELSLIGSRVCTREEFGETLTMLLAIQRDADVDFAMLATAPRKLEQLTESIQGVAAVRENAKVLVSPD